MPHRLTPPRPQGPLRALGAFVTAVLLALVASAALLLPDATVQSVDSMSGVLEGLGRTLDKELAGY